jgi:acyl-coenzyme A thioesterase PaaI-like protein
MPASSTPKQDQQAILEQVLRSIERNREPGFHFAGNFLGFSFDEVTPAQARMSMQGGPHCTDETGQIAFTPACIFTDMALGSSLRGRLQRPTRVATVSMQLQFTGARWDGPLTALSTFDAFFAGSAAQQGVMQATVRNGRGEQVCAGTACFMVLETPPGVKPPRMLPLAPTPPGTPTLAPQALDREEAAIYRQAQAALKREEPFLSGFWDFHPRRTASGGAATLKNGPYVANRVGHVQGGVLTGLAEAAARAALPQGWLPTGLTACFLSPGEGARLSARAKIVHKGSRTAVVEATVTGPDRKRVLELLVNYAAPAR